MAAGCADRGRTEHENEERPVSLVALRFLGIPFRPGRCPRACARVRARGKEVGVRGAGQRPGPTARSLAKGEGGVGRRVGTIRLAALIEAASSA
jgi:hypothetical protein